MPDNRLATDFTLAGTSSLERTPSVWCCRSHLALADPRGAARTAARRLQLTELVGATLMHGDDSQDEVQLQVVDAAVGDVDTIHLRDIERQAPAGGCRG